MPAIEHPYLHPIAAGRHEPLPGVIFVVLSKYRMQAGLAHFLIVPDFALTSNSATAFASGTIGSGGRERTGLNSMLYRPRVRVTGSSGSIRSNSLIAFREDSSTGSCPAKASATHGKAQRSGPPHENFPFSRTAEWLVAPLARKRSSLGHPAPQVIQAPQQVHALAVLHDLRIHEVQGQTDFPATICSRL